MIKSSDLVWIVVSDLKKARKFFTDVVGLQEYKSSEEHGWIELCGDEGGSFIGLAQENPDMQAGQNAIITLTVDDIEKTCAAYKKKGVNFIGDIMEVPGHVKLQMFTDLDGNLFQIVEMIEDFEDEEDDEEYESDDEDYDDEDEEEEE